MKSFFCKLLLFIIICICSVTLFSQSVRVDNIQFYFDKSINEVIVFYDLSESSEFETYEISLSFLDGNNLIIKPKSVSGDIGKDVTGGEKKRIHWEIFNDVNELSETSQPIIIIASINNTPVDPSLTYIVSQINISNKNRYQFKIQRDGLLLAGIGSGIGAVVLKVKADDFVNQQILAANLEEYNIAGENASRCYTTSRITASASVLCIGGALYQYIWSGKSVRKKMALNAIPLIPNGFNLILSSSF
jgi:hypothetical protein